METIRERQSKTYRLSAEAIALLAVLARQSGITRTAMLELIIRREAKREGVKT